MIDVSNAENVGTVFALDDNKQEVEIKYTQPLPAQCLISSKPIDNKKIRTALYACAEKLLADMGLVLCRNY